METVNDLFISIANWFRGWIVSLGANSTLETVLMSLLFVAGVVVFILVNVLYLVYLERKVAGYMQQRLGPNRWGPRGLFQTIWDALKLLGKEDVIPDAADKWVFRVAGIAIFIPAILVFAVIPFGKGMTPIDLDTGILFFVAVSSMSVIAMLMAGWSSNNKYSLLGGMRSVAQTVSYEIPMVFSLLGVVMLTQSMKLSDIVVAQQNMWFVVLQPIAFIIYAIAATAELNRGPFDLPEGEQEIVAGPFTEYSGMRYALFFLAEYTNLVSVSALAATVFLGGWQGPWLPSWLWFLIKTYLMIFIFMWFKWTFPRIRIDHLMHLNWKFLLPLSLANVLLTGVGIKLYQAYQAAQTIGVWW